MYSKEEAAQTRHEFWTIFGKYMAPQLSADGLKINWINYKTGIPGIQFKMDADNKKATIAIVLAHTDKGIQELHYEQFLQLKQLLHSTLNEQWTWEPSTTNEFGKQISRIYMQLNNVNVMHRDDWPQIISFLKPRLTALDEFWNNAKYPFEELK